MDNRFDNMAPTARKGERLAGALARRRRVRRLLAVLSIMAVLVTAISLMLPAISMTRGDLVCSLEEHAHSASCYEKVLVCGQEEGEGADSETGEGGHVHTKDCYEKKLVCEIPEHKHSDACYEQAQPDDKADDEGKDDSGDDASDSGKGADDGGAAAADGGDADKGEASAGAADSSASASSASASSVGAVEAGSDSDMPAQSFKADLKDAKGKVTLTVEVEAPEGAFPAGTFMKIDGVDASDIEGAVEKAVAKKADGKVTQIQAVDIAFHEGGAEGAEIEPARDITVKLTSKLIAENEKPLVVHVDDKGKADVVDTLTKKQLKKRDLKAKDDQLLFDSDKFSTYGIVITSLEQTLTASDGNAYTVTVTAPANAGVPSDAGLDVRELVEGTDEYDSYCRQAADALGSEPGYARLFDISILDADGNKIQPAAPVAVEIALDDADGLSDDVKAVHFAGDDVQLLDASLSGDTVSFDAESFSVYAVVDGSTEANARMKLVFYSGENLIATMYVKNCDELLGDGERDPSKEYVDDIIFDPGVGVLESGEVFTGWILDKQNYATGDIDDAMTIEQIRAWAVNQEITEGETEHRFDAAICKIYTITYKDDDGTVLGMDAVPVKSSEFGTAEVARTVNMAYTPKDDVHNFEGWTLDEESDGNVASSIPGNRIYANGDSITIKGDISFTVNAPQGNWLVFSENGKGATYNAPQFVKSGQVTVSPRPDAEMSRNGYTFGGWYDTKEHADAHGANTSVTTGKFTFGGEINGRTTLYASWIPNTTAPYTVILWGQNVDRTAYEVLDSYVNNGRVGQNIPYNVVENGDEDYVTGVGSYGHYTGFNLREASKNQAVTITPEGDAVLNLYYDRILYNFKFYLYRSSGNGQNRYTYANNSGSGSSLNDLVTWHSGSSNHPGVSNSSDYTIQTETHRFNNTNYTYYYFTISAYYGQDISSIWPTYDKITGADGREAVSYVMMVGTKLKPSATSSGSGTVKGIITVMNENILGATNDANGNYVMVRFPDSYYNWRYHIWFETVEGEDYTGKTTRTYNGKTYYEDTVLEVRSSNTQVSSQNEPKYQGFTFLEKRGQNWNNSSYWTTGNNPTLYHLNFVYNREAFKISYFDGAYVNGNGGPIQSRSTHLLHESGNINQGAPIPATDRNYVPQLPEGEEGYVFEGWYLDEGCTVPYPWGTMPVGGIKVYAKWRQVQYRVFLHPNAGTDPSLDWGDEGEETKVSTSFRVAYGEKVSTPTGKRENSGYEFVGWYTDPSLSSQYLYNPDTVLNDETVTEPYLKTEDTELDKWGNPTETGNGDVNRPWITRKLDLYAKWRKILEGAGINVVYSAVDGEGHEGGNPPVDAITYPDKADTNAQAACTPPEGMYFKCWVIQRWDETANEGQGAYVDTDMTVVPGQQFTVDEQYARKEAIEGTTDHKYTMQLRAEYEEPSTGIQTHIWWFDNYSDDGAERHNSSRQDENIKINEVKEIKSAPTRNGYSFLGWARVMRSQSDSQEGTPPTGKVLDLKASDLYLAYDSENKTFKLQDSGSEDNGKEVTQVAADERLEYHDMYAVWKKKTYTVTVIKKTTESEYQDTPFKFTPSGFPESVQSGSSDFWLVGNTSGATVDETEYSHTKVFEEVPYGTEFAITETTDDFDVSVKYDCADADDTTKNVNGAGSTNGGTIKVDGNITVTFTNAPKAQKLLIKKVGNDETSTNGLPGAKFDLTSSDAQGFDNLIGLVSMDAESDAGNLGYLPGNDATDVTLFKLPSGTYTLSEKDSPANYFGVKDVTISVNASGISITKDEGDTITLGEKDANGVYTLTVTDTLITIPIKIVKTDQTGAALAGAKFTSDLFSGTVTTQITGTGADAQAIILDTTSVTIGEYALTETAAPAGYNQLAGSVMIEVSEGQVDGDVIVTPTINGEQSAFVVAQRVDASHPELGWIVTIKNDAGVELPTTGGSGTGLFYLFGAILIALAGAWLVTGKRRKER